MSLTPFGFLPFGFLPFGFLPFGFLPFGFLPFGFLPGMALFCDSNFHKPYHHLCLCRYRVVGPC